jgi:putative ABC transport system permease protein
MNFVILMALREVRASWRRLLFFFVCVAIGVGAIVLLRSVIQTVRTTLMSEARSRLGADVVVGTNRPWTPELQKIVDDRIAHAPVRARMETIDVATLVRPASGGAAVARMVELRGVEPAFPFYGAVTLTDGRPYSPALLAGHGILVRPELLTQLAIDVGDAVVVGGQPFTIRGVIAQEPGRRAGGFSFGSRVLIDLQDLKGTGLLTFGSRANYRLLLRVDEAGVEPLEKQLRADLAPHFAGATSYRSVEDDIGEDLARAENYLSLVGFVVLILGGIGVWSVTRVFVRQKVKSIAILKCVGATTRQVLAAYVLQVVLLGLAGSAARRRPRAAGSRRSRTRRRRARRDAYSLTLSAVWQGIAVGLLVSLLFSLVPLLEVRRVKPLLLLRGGHDGRCRARRHPRVVDACRASARGSRPSIARRRRGACSSARRSSRSRRGRRRRCASAPSSAAASPGSRSCCTWSAAASSARCGRSRARGGFRCARGLSLARPGNQTRVILLAVGIGSFFVIGVRSLQANLLQQFTLQLGTGGADMFLIEILPPQVDGVRAFLDARKAPGRRAAADPVMRARVTGVRGRDVNLESFEDVRQRGSLGREYTITYRDHLAAERDGDRRRLLVVAGHRRGRRRSRSRRASTSASRSTSGTSSVSTSPAGRWRRGSRAYAK